MTTIGTVYESMMRNQRTYLANQDNKHRLEDECTDFSLSTSRNGVGGVSKRSRLEAPDVTVREPSRLQSQQNEGESLDSFHTRLRTLAKTCEFADAKEQIILSCKSNALGRKALREGLDLTALLKAGRALERSETQGKEVESDKTTANTVKHKKKSDTCSKKGKGRRREQHSESRSKSHKESRKTDESSKCRNCDGAYPHKDSCPARNKKCTSIILLMFVGQFHPVQ
ncbi:hypothetical protein ACROYT_G040142 [Oculina patagonica]